MTLCTTTTSPHPPHSAFSIEKSPRKHDETMSKRILNGCLLWTLALILVSVVGLWVTFKAYKDYYAHTRPPVTRQDDRAAFLEMYSHSEPERVFVDGQECVLYFGHIPDRWSTHIVLPSGPPAYVFETLFGRLVRWFPDSGEGDFKAWRREVASSAKKPAP